ncbi:MAG: hypothetical protein KDD03_01850 [Gelidibacter sp.]|nr:hypothetical protein [Gelidibacter sp.]
MDDKNIIKAFNQGYTIQKHHPELAEKLLKGMEGQKSDFITAFIKGSGEYQKEMMKEPLKEIKLNYRLKEHDLPKIDREKNKDREKEK